MQLMKKYMYIRGMGSKTLYLMGSRSKEPADHCFMAFHLIFYLAQQWNENIQGKKFRKRRFQIGQVIFTLGNSFPVLCILKKAYVALSH